MADKIQQNTRRDFLKKAGYTTPAILTIGAAPAFANTGSGVVRGNNGIGQEKRGEIDGPPPGLAGKPNQDFNDNGNFAPLGESGAQAGGRPWGTQSGKDAKGVKSTKSAKSTKKGHGHG